MSGTTQPSEEPPPLQLPAVKPIIKDMAYVEAHSTTSTDVDSRGPCSVEGKGQVTESV